MPWRTDIVIECSKCGAEFREGCFHIPELSTVIDVYQLARGAGWVAKTDCDLCPECMEKGENNAG